MLNCTIYLTSFYLTILLNQTLVVHLNDVYHVLDICLLKTLFIQGFQSL